MIESSDFNTLLLLFRRPGALPALPANTMRLIKEIDGGEASTCEIEQIITSDPALTANILRMSNTGEFGGCPGGNLRTAIFLVGQRSIRALALSSLVQALLRTKYEETLFVPEAYIRHSMFVGFLARYVAARAEREGKTIGCTPDEVFAAGMLHDLSFALLARIAPKVFNRLYLWAKRNCMSLDAAFMELYGLPANILGAEACRSLNLPPLFVNILEHAHEPWECDALYTSICALSYADYTAQGTDWRVETWTTEGDLSLVLADEVGLLPGELDVVIPSIGNLVSKATSGWGGAVSVRPSMSPSLRA